MLWLGIGATVRANIAYEAGFGVLGRWRPSKRTRCDSGQEVIPVASSKLRFAFCRRTPTPNHGSDWNRCFKGMTATDLLQRALALCRLTQCRLAYLDHARDVAFPDERRLSGPT